MSAIRSALDELLAVDDGELSAGELASDLVELAHVGQMVEVLTARKIKSLADRGGHHVLGYSSPTAFLVDQTRVSPGHARRLVSYGNASEKAPHAHDAWADGRLSTDQAQHLFRAAEAVPDQYPQAEDRLVGIVEGLDAVDTGRAVEYWRQAVDGPGELDPETQQQRRGLSVSETSEGMRRVDGWLTPLAGEALETALDALTPPHRDGDHRTPRQRRHDALEDLCRDWLENGTTPTIGGEKPQVIVHVDLPALQGEAGGLHETENGQILDIDTVRMLACDASITRIIFGPESEVLDVGRKTRVWTAAQRRAIVARDRHCQGPGCRAKPRHCDIHHVNHWGDGGDTNVEDGQALLPALPHHRTPQRPLSAQTPTKNLGVAPSPAAPEPRPSYMFLRYWPPAA
jgi:hypothetical protein